MMLGSQHRPCVTLELTRRIPIVQSISVDLTQMLPTGNRDGFTLKSTDSGTRAFLNIYGSFADG